MPEGGFEPPTRGFSIRCSTPELLGLHRGTLRGSAAYREAMRPLASAKSVSFATTETVLIFGWWPRNAITFVEPFDEVAVLATLAAKWLMLHICRLFAERAEISFARHGHGHSR